MVYWNQEKGSAVGDYNQQYFFDDAAGDDVTVYVLDMGAYTDNPVRSPCLLALFY